MQIKFGFGKIDADFDISNLTIQLAGLYSVLCRQEFPDTPSCPEGFERMVNFVYRTFGQEYSYIEPVGVEHRKLNGPDDRVLLLFSGGLDSCFQAVKLKEAGYDVTLLNVENINAYENNVISKNVVGKFADKAGMKLVKVNISHSFNKSNPFKKHWSENPIKNQLMMSVAADYCYANNIHIISIGDDKALVEEHSVPGVNTTDCKELSDISDEAFKGIYEGLDIIYIDSKYKGDDEVRLKTLYDNGQLDCYCSCVGPGRLIKSQNTRYRQKFNINIPEWNCCSCRKCARHMLVMHYSDKFDFTMPEDAVSHCWNKCATSGKSADFYLYDNSLPIETRIKNLFNYI